MTLQQFRDRLNALRFIDRDQLAEALGGWLVAASDAKAEKVWAYIEAQS